MFDLAYLAFQINLESTADQPEPGLCLAGPSKSTWNPQLDSRSQGFAWQGLPNQLGTHSSASQGQDFAWQGLLNGRGTHSLASQVQGFAWQGLPHELGTTAGQPGAGLCLAGPSKSTWKPELTSQSQGFAWQGLPNQLGTQFASQS